VNAETRPGNAEVATARDSSEAAGEVTSSAAGALPPTRSARDRRFRFAASAPLLASGRLLGRTTFRRKSVDPKVVDEEDVELDRKRGPTNAAAGRVWSRGSALKTERINKYW